MSTETLEAPPARAFLTVAQFVAKHPWMTLGELRSLLFNRETNGFAGCVRNLGKKILLDEPSVFAWIDRQNGKSA
jgi:hypothetical protein